jgi:hypothetical protein
MAMSLVKLAAESVSWFACSGNGKMSLNCNPLVARIALSDLVRGVSGKLLERPLTGAFELLRLEYATREL